jgi:hypothetical protein
MRSASLFVVHIVKHSGVARGRRGFILITCTINSIVASLAHGRLRNQGPLFWHGGQEGWTQWKRGGGVTGGGGAGDSGSLYSNIDHKKSVCQCHLWVVCMSGL